MKHLPSFLVDLGSLWYPCGNWGAFVMFYRCSLFQHRCQKRWWYPSEKRCKTWRSSFHVKTKSRWSGVIHPCWAGIYIIFFCGTQKTMMTRNVCEMSVSFIQTTVTSLWCRAALACHRLFLDLLFSMDELESNQSVRGFLNFTVKCNKDPVYRSNFQWAELNTIGDPSSHNRPT